MPRLYHLIFIRLILILFFSTSHAEITFDGSLGPSIKLSGPNYTIKADKGTLMGSNLFHSFRTFNIHSGESATFTAPETVANIIGRITGGSASQINGTLKIDSTLESTISHANLYLLNPNGFIWGPNARLDINGSFYLSSADYLRFADGQHFDTHFTPSPLLTIAPPKAFGFLDNPDKPLGDITIEGKLMVEEEKNLVVIGRDISISGGKLVGKQAHVKIVSVASEGEIINFDLTDNILFGKVEIKDGRLEVNADTKSGSILILSGQFFMSGSNIQSYGNEGTGNIEIISTGKMKITENSEILIQTDQKNAGKIVLQGKSIVLDDKGTTIISRTFGQGQGGSLNITASESINMETSTLEAVTFGKGNAGNINIETNNLTLINGAQINTKSKSMGNAGTITIQAKGIINVSGYSLENGNINPSGIISNVDNTGDGDTIQISALYLNLDNWATIQSLTKGKGNAGNIVIETNNLELANGAQINASSKGAGKGGNIDIETNMLDITGFIELNEKNRPNGITNSTCSTDDNGTLPSLNPSGIASSAFSSGDSGTIQISALSLNLDNLATIQTLTKCEGKSGNISIDVNELRIMGGADIDASNEGTGIDKGGNITITATDSVLITATPGEDEDNQFVVETGFLGGIYSSANKNGAGGDITLSTRKLTMRNGGVISAGSEGTGNAGNLLLNIGEELNLDNAAILTRAQKAGGGNMTFHINERLDLFNSQISAEAKGENELHQGGNLTIYPINLIHLYKSQIFTDGYTGNGGSLTIKKANFMTLNQSKIFTGAVSGDGGNINITANHFLRSSDSVLDAFSELGLDGDIIINAPDVDLTGSLAILPKTFIDASQLLFKNCSNYTNPNKSFLKFHKLDGLFEVFVEEN